MLREGAGCLQSVAEYLGLTPVCVWGGELWEGYNCYFGVFYSMGGFIFVGTRCWVLGSHSMGFRNFPNTS